MRRVTMTPRANWRPGLSKYSFGGRAVGAGARWREDVRYEFQSSQIDLIENTADEVHGMVLQTMRWAVDNRLLGNLHLSLDAQRIVEHSWSCYAEGGVRSLRAGGLIGRLTFAYDGRDSLRLVGCDYDTPAGVFAAAVIQRNWLETMIGDADQFNGLHEALIERWEELAGSRRCAALHFVYSASSRIEAGEVAYLAAVAEEAGIAVHILPIQAMEWDGRQFLDDTGQAIGWLAKRYPWQTLMASPFTDALRGGTLAVSEPPWRWAPSLGGFLALMWRLYPGHPNLCPAGFEPEELDAEDSVWARESFGGSAAAWRMVDEGRIVSGSERAPSPPLVWLETPLGFASEGAYAVIDAWIVGDKCMGMTVRESEDRAIGPDASIVPHLLRL